MCHLADVVHNFSLLYRVNWLIHNFLQRDPTTRSLHTAGSQSYNLSSRGSLHVTTNNEPTSSRNEAGLQTVSECFNEETRRHSSGITLEPLGESSRDIRNSRASLNVPGNIASARRLSADDVEEIIVSPPASAEICLEIPQTGNIVTNASPKDTGGDMTQASASDIHYSDSSPKSEKKSDEANINALATSSLSPSLGEVHFMRPLAGVAWTKNSISHSSAAVTSRSSLRSFLRPKMQQSGSQSAPSSPVTRRSTKF